MKNKSLWGASLVLVFIAGAIAAVVIEPQIQIRERRSKELTGKSIQWNGTTKPLPEGVKTYIVGTTDSGKGLVSAAWVRAEPGIGKILVDIENLFFWVDIQHSIRTASSFSKDYLDIEKDEHDLTYSMDLNVSIVGGPSAGAALTVATIAALKNRSISKDVVMTGTVEPDGRIGKVGGVLAKAKAVEEMGFDKFLVPEGQSIHVKYTKEENCRSLGAIDICRTEYIQEKTDIDEELDLEVVEVKNIEEAINHFL